MPTLFCYAQTISKRFPNWENGYVICGYISVLQHEKQKAISFKILFSWDWEKRSEVFHNLINYFICNNYLIIPIWHNPA